MEILFNNYAHEAFIDLPCRQYVPVLMLSEDSLVLINSESCKFWLFEIFDGLQYSKNVMFPSTEQ